MVFESTKGEEWKIEECHFSMAKDLLKEFLDLMKVEDHTLLKLR